MLTSSYSGSLDSLGAVEGFQVPWQLWTLSPLVPNLYNCALGPESPQETDGGRWTCRSGCLANSTGHGSWGYFLGPENPNSPPLDPRREQTSQEATFNHHISLVQLHRDGKGGNGPKEPHSLDNPTLWSVAWQIHRTRGRLALNLELVFFHPLDLHCPIWKQLAV